MADRTFPIKSTLSELGNEGASVFEREISYINELAEVLCDEAGEDEIFFEDDAFISRYKELFKEKDIQAADFNKDKSRANQKINTLSKKALLCVRICDILGIKGLRSVETFFDGCENSGEGSISYVRNPYADKAYLSFASVLLNASSTYKSDFTQVCEDVYYGRTDYCILPLSDGTNGKLSGFRNLAVKYDLKTVYTVSVNAGENEVSEFALMKKEIELPKKHKKVSFEFRLKDEKELFNILCVGKYCGMEAEEIYLSGNKAGGSDIVMNVNEDGICGFLAYLCLEHPDFTPVGIYSKI